MATTLAVLGSATSSKPFGPKLMDESDLNSKPPVCGDSISEGETATGAAVRVDKARRERRAGFMAV
jgi:hypothetical protein